MTLTHDELGAALRSALMQIDDLSSLRRSPLLPILCPGATAPLALQQALVAAIEEVALLDDPFAAAAHELLYFRYIERLTQQQLAYQMGVSVRHLRRQQENALELLTGLISKRLLLPADPNHGEPLQSQPGPNSTPAQERTLTTAVAGEIAWLRTGVDSTDADLGETLAKAIHGVQVLAEHYHVELLSPPPAPTVTVAVPAPVLRQALLTTLAWAVSNAGAYAATPTHTTQRPLVTFGWLESEHEVGIKLTINKCNRGATNLSAFNLGASNSASELEIVGQLLLPFGGSMTYAAHASEGSQVTVHLPRVGSVPILVVDDNPDIRQLFQRYTTHSRFQVVTTSEPAPALTHSPANEIEQVLDLAQRQRVQAIVLDIMMPGVDGWDLLAQLRHHPVTQTIPVVVCTILPQRQLAHLLGAVAFLQKPVSQMDLLATLNQITAPGATALA